MQSDRIARHSSEHNEHYSPPDVLALARHCLGDFDLDPASCEAANRLVKARSYYSLDNPGQHQPWFGRVWLNPPGGLVDENWRPIRKGCNETGECGLAPGHTHKGRMSSAVKWFYKLAGEYSTGRTNSAMFLAFSVEMLQTAQEVVPGLPDPLDFPVCIPRKRIDFISGRTMQPQGSPAHANAIVYMPPLAYIREGVACFRSYFGQLGRVIVPRWCDQA